MAFLTELLDRGVFTGRPVEKQIEWQQNGETLSATVYVRPEGYHTATSAIMAAGGRIDGIAGRIAASICDADGKPVFTVADITGEADPARGALCEALTLALLTAIQEVNDAGKPPAN